MEQAGEAAASVGALFFTLTLADTKWMLRNSYATVFFASIPAILPVTGLYLQTFTWIKIWMLSLGVLVFHFVPSFLHSSNNKKKNKNNKKQQIMLKWMVPIMLAINILGPSAFMAMKGRWLNVAIAFLLLMTMEGPSGVGRDRQGLLSYSLKWEWVLCYTFWNFDFVGGSYPRHQWEHIAVLGVPLLVAWRNPSKWMSSRGYTLTAYIMVLLVVVDAYQAEWLPSTLPFLDHSIVLTITQTLSLISALYLIVTSSNKSLKK